MNQHVIHEHCLGGLAAEEGTCESLQKLFDSTLTVENGKFVLATTVHFSFPGTYDEPGYEDADEGSIEITHCPFCGARLILGEYIAEADTDEVDF